MCVCVYVSMCVCAWWGEVGLCGRVCVWCVLACVCGVRVCVFVYVQVCLCVEGVGCVVVGVKLLLNAAHSN